MNNLPEQKACVVGEGKPNAVVGLVNRYGDKLSC
jgi:hypothetical protein